jgi:hypothetical protein
MIAWDKKDKATYTETNGDTQGKVTLDGVTYHVMNWHSFDDFGQTIETVQVWNPITKLLSEIYSMDEGETFSYQLND